MQKNYTRYSRHNKAKKNNKRRSSLFSALKFFIIGIVLACLLFYYKSIHLSSSIHPDMQKIINILQTIEKTSGILGFTHVINPIDYLNVKEFAGDTIGCIKLKRPEEWQGPFLNSNLRYKNHPYALLVNKTGYYLIPGDGVVLDSGQIIGKDIIFDYDTDMENILKKYPTLKENNKILVCHVALS